MTAAVRPSLLVEHLSRLAGDLAASAKVADAKALARYQRDPVAWAVEQLGVPSASLRWAENPGYAKHKWHGSHEPIVAILMGLTTHRRVGVEAAVATQKTYTLAIILLWFLACFENATVVTFAPKEKQLEKHLWKEISRLYPRFRRLYPLSELTHLRLRMRRGSDVWSAYGYAVGVGADEESAVKAQGAHDRDMLFIVEETPGVHPAIMNALLNTAVGPHNIIVAVGNPDHQLDTLHEFCTKALHCLHIRIAAPDHPNIVCGREVIPGAVTADSIAEKELRYGGVEAPLYRSRVLGISPAESTDALIKLSWCYAAAKRTVPSDKDPAAPAALGVDVANSKDGDRGAIARGKGARLLEVETFPCPNANLLGGRVAVEAREGKIPAGYIGVDGVGVGAGTVNELLAQGLSVQNLLGGNAPIPFIGGEEKFKNLRAQMAWLLRLDLQHERIALPLDEELFEELITPTWTTKGSVIVVEAKEELKKRLGRSPNKADAVMYWNWVRQVGGTSGGGVMIDL